MDIFSIFLYMKVCYVFSLESPHSGDSTEYIQYTIFNIKIRRTRHRKRYNPLALYHSSYWSHCWMDTHFLMYLLRVL